MKAKTVDGGRKAVFSASDVKLWRNFLDSLVDFQVIERGHPLADNAADIQAALEAILEVRVPKAVLAPAAPAEESDADN